ncbi:MAG: anaerobic ribonucleoside-triphosphate reductase activating protein [Bacilli bacterium]|nr:anaerobic ribonucleoside-triphosphate reductase activating protein [Bacilli bacterium]
MNIINMDFVGLDKMSLLDYEDKVSCVLFAKPCNFRCPFCHNGDLVLQAELVIPWADIIAYLEKRKGLIDAVVFSGGEPTLMPDLKEKIIEVKNMGYDIKLDTNGTRPEIVKDLIDSKLIDYVAMDIKNEPKLYATTCGRDAIELEKIKETINLLINSGIDYEFRTTLVKELHENTNFDEMGKFIEGARKLYLQKFVDREGCIVRGLNEVNQQKAEEYAEILRKYIKQVELRGY